LLFCLVPTAASIAQGLLSVPDVSGASVSADASLVQGLPFGGEIEYRYTIDNPAASTGNIWLFEVDVSAKERTRPSGIARTYPVQDGAATASMEDDAELLDPFLGEKGRDVLLVTQLAPAGWNGGLTRSGTVQYYVGDTAFAVQPGATATGLTMRISRPPTIRQYSVTPDWVLLVDDHDFVTEQEVADAALVTQSLPVVVAGVKSRLFAATCLRL